jgi:hypothetical protein
MKDVEIRETARGTFENFYSYYNIYPYILRSVFYAVKRITETLIRGTV